MIDYKRDIPYIFLCLLIIVTFWYILYILRNWNRQNNNINQNQNQDQNNYQQIQQPLIYGRRQILIWKFKGYKQNQDLFCSLQQTQISNQEKYTICKQCKNAFDFDSLAKWFQMKQTCPICRNEWNEFEYYINSEQSEYYINSEQSEYYINSEQSEHCINSFQEQEIV